MARAAVGTAFRHLRDIFEAGPVAGLEDAELLGRYAGAKDEAAFEALVSRHGSMVLATCRAVLRNDHDVEDAFQATFLVLARKAGSIRGSNALGGWLHRVAYRASVQASVEAVRRRRIEAEASAMTSLSRPEPDPDWKPILHEEISRLPDGQRLPVVLCDLEGLTYEQAAGQLGWTVPTLRCRLARARQRLGGRLTRRGVSAMAVGALLAPRGASASTVPLALVRAAVAAATSGSISSGASLLAHAVLKGMFMTRIKLIATAVLAALALTAAGVLASGGAGEEDPRPAIKPEPAAQAAREEPKGLKPVEMVEVRGVVVTPEGRPVAGAAVRAMFYRPEDATPGTTSGTDGRFSVLVPRWDLHEVGELEGSPWIIAAAPGFGIGWAEGVLRAGRPAELALKLVPEGPPIEGRVIDLEGRPIVGAGVKLSGISFEERGDLAGWIARARRGAEGNLWQGLEKLPIEKVLPIETTTGPDGRFLLRGVGRDRIADLLIRAPGIATTPVHVLSRAEPELRLVDRGMMTAVPLIVHAPKFELALPPARRIEGIARDSDSGKPIAGLEITAAVFDRKSLIRAEGIEARTDAEGRYRIDGLPSAPAYRLFVAPGKGLPYVKATLKVPADSPAFDPIAFDIRLKRGLLVHLNITDKATGRPMLGEAYYFAFVDNPHIRDHAGFTESHYQSAHIDEVGRYTIVALPGRGLIAVQDAEGRFRPAAGYERIPGYDPKFRHFETVPELVLPDGYAVLAEVNLAPDAGETLLNLQADSGRSVAVEVVGPDGRPLGGTKVKGVSEMYATGPLPRESARFEIHALDPKNPRRVVVTHSGRKLIGSALIKGDEAGPVVVKLQPWGTISGRIVDDEGHPRKAMFISSPTGSENKHPETHDILPGSDWNSGIRVGDDGRFVVEGLVPGLRYSAASRTGFEAFGDLFTDVIVAAGEARDLGDLKVQPPRKQGD